MKIASIIFLIFLVGCAPTVTIGDKFVLNGKTCQWAEISASMSSKQLDNLCIDENGNWQLVATAGRPGGQVFSEAIRSLAITAAISAAAQVISEADFGADVSVDIPGL